MNDADVGRCGRTVEMMRKRSMIALLLTGVSSSACGIFGGSTSVEVAEEANAGGIEIVATSSIEQDSVQVDARITNTLDTTADLILDGDCPVTLIAYRDDRLLWDERGESVCDDTELPVPLAPGEVEILSHSVPRAALEALAPDDYLIGVRVLLAAGREYVLQAPARK